MQIVIAIVLAAHGIGHSLGLFPLVGLAPTAALPKWTGESWLLRGRASMPMRVVSGLLWLAAAVGFVLLAAVVMGWLPEAWWQPLAVAASAVSLVALVIFPSGFPTAVNLIGAAAVDIGVLVAVIAYSWAPSALDG
jgi:hypothetical protein